jgi:hypothetical protein
VGGAFQYQYGGDCSSGQGRVHQGQKGYPTVRPKSEIFGGAVTANIGWYVISILHDRPPCNIDITWP